MLHTGALQKRGRSLLPGSIFSSRANTPVQQAASLPSVSGLGTARCHTGQAARRQERARELLSVFSMWLREHSKTSAGFVCLVLQRRKSMWELQIASALPGDPGGFPTETGLNYSSWLTFADQVLFHYSKTNTEEAFCERALFFQMEGGETNICIISDTCFSDFTWFQEDFLLSDIELSLASLFFFFFFPMPWDPV